MASLNTRRKPQLPPQGGVSSQRFEPSNSMRTHQGAPAANISAELMLRRSVCSCLLWEDTFYESGQSIADRIVDLAGQVAPKIVADLAYDARTHFNLRHVPMLLCAALARTGSGSRLVSDTLFETIQRADELSEFLAVYAKVNGVEPKALKKKLSAQVKKGLARAFGKFDEYQLAKYFSPSAEAGQPIKARDVMFMVHPRPKDEAQDALWKRLVAGEVKGADTWENALSTGPVLEEGETVTAAAKVEHKRETFERQMREGKLGYLALLRNLRNMTEAGVDQELLLQTILARRGARRVLPFRYVAAARACPKLVGVLDHALSEAISEMKMLPGKTVVLVDVSGSMDHKLSDKSDLTRMDAAAALAAVIHGDVRVFSFSNSLVEVPEARGLSGIDNILRSQHHGGTELAGAIAHLNGGTAHYSLRAQRGREPVEMDRLIVITDEQAASHVPDPKVKRAYMINVATYQHGVGYGEAWTHLDGFSEQVIRFIHEFEAL